MKKELKELQAKCELELSRYCTATISYITELEIAQLKKAGARLITQEENRTNWFEEFYERINSKCPDIVAQILKDMGGEFS